MTLEDEHQESDKTDDDTEPNEETDELDEADAEIAALLDEVERLTAENTALNARVGECESAIATLREHRHEPEPGPAPEPDRLPEPEPEPEDNHWYTRRIGKHAT